MAGGTPVANLRVTIDGKSAEAGMRSLAQGSDKLARSLLGVNSAARTLGGMSLAKVFAGLSVGYLTYELFGMSKQILEIGNQFQGLKVAMESAVGNKSRAAQEMKFVREEANRLGVNVIKSVDAFTKLAASTRDTALEGEMTRRAFTAIAQAARALSLSSEQQYGAFVAIYQIASKAKVSMEELRQQLGDRLPGAMNIAARAMGMTTNDFYDFVAAGKLASTDFLPKFIAELEKLYTAGAQAAAKLPTAELERLVNTLYETANVLYEEGIGEAFAELFRNLNAAIKSISFSDLSVTAQIFGKVLSSIGSIVVFLADNLDTLLKLLFAIFAGKIMAGISNMVSGFMTWRKELAAARVESQKTLENELNWLRKVQREYAVAERNAKSYQKRIMDLNLAETQARNRGMAAATARDMPLANQLKSALNAAYLEYNKFWQRFQANSQKYGEAFAKNVMVAPFTTMEQKLQQLSATLKNANDSWSAHNRVVQENAKIMSDSLAAQSEYAKKTDLLSRGYEKAKNALLTANNAVAASYVKVQAAAASAAAASITIGRAIWSAAISFVNFAGVISGVIAGFLLFKDVLLDWRSEIEKATDESVKNFETLLRKGRDLPTIFEDIKKEVIDTQNEIRYVVAALDDYFANPVNRVKELQSTFQRFSVIGTIPQLISDFFNPSPAKEYEEQLKDLQDRLEKLAKVQESYRKELEKQADVERDAAKVAAYRTSLTYQLARAVEELSRAQRNATTETDVERATEQVANLREAITAANPKNVPEYDEQTKRNIKLTMDYIASLKQAKSLLQSLGVDLLEAQKNQMVPVLDEKQLEQLDEAIDRQKVMLENLKEQAKYDNVITQGEAQRIGNLDAIIKAASELSKLYKEGASEDKKREAALKLQKALNDANSNTVKILNEQYNKQLETIRDINKALREQREDRERELQTQKRRLEIANQIAQLAIQEPPDLAAIDKLMSQLRDLDVVDETQKIIIQNNRTLEQSFGNLGKVATSTIADASGEIQNLGQSTSNAIAGIDGDIRILLTATDKFSTVSQANWNSVAEAINNVPESIRQIPPEIIMAMGIVESQLSRSAVNKDTGALGIFQFMPKTLEKLKQDSRMTADTVEQDVLRMIIWLKKLADQYGSLEKAIAAHNFKGENAGAFFEKWGDAWKEHLPEETKNFLENVKGIIPVLQQMGIDAAGTGKAIGSMSDSMGEGDADIVEFAQSTALARDHLADLQTLASVGINTQEIERYLEISRELATLEAPLGYEQRAIKQAEYDQARSAVMKDIVDLQEKINTSTATGIDISQLQTELNAKQKLLEIGEAQYELSKATTAQEKLAAVERLLSAKSINVNLKTQDELYEKNVASLHELNQSLKDINRQIASSDLEFQLEWAKMVGATADEYARLQIAIWHTTADYEKLVNTIKTSKDVNEVEKAKQVINQTEEMMRTEASRSKFMEAMSGISDAWDDVWNAMIDETKSFTEFMSDFLKQWLYKLAGEFIKTKLVLPIAAEIVKPFYDLNSTTSGAGAGTTQVVDAVNQVGSEAQKTTDAVKSVEKTTGGIGTSMFKLLGGLFQGTWQFLASIITLLSTGSFAQAGESMTKAGKSITEGFSGISNFFGGNSIANGLNGAFNPFSSNAFDARFAARTGMPVPSDTLFGGANWGYGLAGTAGYFGGSLLFNNQGYSGIGGSLGGMAGFGLASGSAFAGTAIGSALGSVIAPVIGTVIGTALGSWLGSMFGGNEPEVTGGVSYYDFMNKTSGKAHADATNESLSFIEKLGETMEKMNSAMTEVLGPMGNFGAGMWMDTDSSGRIAGGYNSYSRGVQKADFSSTEEAAKWFVDQMVLDMQEQFKYHADKMGGLGGTIALLFQNLSSVLSADELIAQLNALGGSLKGIMRIYESLDDTLKNEAALAITYYATSVEDMSAILIMAQDVNYGYADSLTDVIIGVQAIQGQEESLINAYQRAITQYKEYQNALVITGRGLVKFDSATIQLSDSLAQAAGGVDNLASLQSSYFENFYTDAERLAAQQKIASQEVALFNEQLGLTGDSALATNDDLRRYIESLDLSTTAGQEAYVNALEVADAFVTMNTVLEDTADAVDEAMQTLQDAMTALYSSNKQLIDLWYSTITTTNQLMGVTGQETANAQAAAEALAGTVYTNLLSGQVSTDTAIAMIEDVIGSLTTWANTVAVLEDAWNQFSDSLMQTIDSLRMSTSNPVSEAGQLAAIDQEIARVQAQYATATGQEQIDLAEQLSDLYQQQLSLGSQVYDRTSQEYIDLYNSTMQALNSLNMAATDSAQSEAEKQNEILSSIVDAINEWAYWESTLLTQQIAEQQQAVTEAASMVNLTAEQNALLQGIIDNATFNSNAIIAAIGGLPTYQQGTPFVPATGLAMLHQGEQVIPVGQSSSDKIVINVTVNGGDAGQVESAVYRALKRAGPELKRIVRRN